MQISGLNMEGDRDRPFAGRDRPFVVGKKRCLLLLLLRETVLVMYIEMPMVDSFFSAV